MSIGAGTSDEKPRASRGSIAFWIIITMILGFLFFANLGIGIVNSMNGEHDPAYPCLAAGMMWMFADMARRGRARCAQ